jgi:hypothetical protein
LVFLDGPKRVTHFPEVNQPAFDLGFLSGQAVRVATLFPIGRAG